MDKQVEKLSRQLKEIAEVLNAFKSEAVQIRIIERLLPELTNLLQPSNTFQSILTSHEIDDLPKVKKKPTEYKGPGSTKILRKLIDTEFFETPRSISEIINHFSQEYQYELEPNQLSGVLLSFVKENKLHRTKSEISQRYVYLKKVLV